MVCHIKERREAEGVQNEVLKNTFGHGGGKVETGEKKHSVWLRDFYCYKNIVLVKLRSMRWAGHVARMEKKRNA